VRVNRSCVPAGKLSLVVVVGMLMLVVPASALATALPVIESESVSHITSTDATLEAQVNLEGVPNGVYYQFQVVREPSEYAPTLICSSTRPQGPDGCLLPQSQGGIPIGFLPGNTEKVSPIMPASLDLASVGETLQPDTTYHYRVIVARRIPTEDTIQWEEPIVFGADHTFTTLSTNDKPSIESESLSHLTPTDATLEGTLNTEGLETTYRFKMWVSPCSAHARGCEDFIDVPLPSGTLLGSFVSQSVSLDLQSAGVHLIPGKEYGWALSATNAAGSAEGEWHTFMSPPEEEASTGLSGGSASGEQGGVGPGLGPFGGALKSAPDLVPVVKHSSHARKGRRHRRHKHRVRPNSHHSHGRALGHQVHGHGR
jgi:hypothetical protein